MMFGYLLRDISSLTFRQKLKTAFDCPMGEKIRCHASPLVAFFCNFFILLLSTDPEVKLIIALLFDIRLPPELRWSTFDAFQRSKSTGL
jgi:hypothetical protein